MVENNGVPIPKVLWKMFGERVRSLGSVLGSSVIRRGDPPDYEALLNRCLVVVSDHSPPFPPIASESFYPHRPQHLVVSETIEKLISNRSASSNVMCSGYNWLENSSPLVKILSTPEWCLLLKRVGEVVMYHLLYQASMFLPLNHTNYHQVVGLPITKMCPMWSTDTFKARILNSQPTGIKKKRKREDDGATLSRKRQRISSFEIGETSSIITSIASSEVGDSLRSISCDVEKDKHNQTLDVAIPITDHVVLNSENGASQKIRQNAEQDVKRKKKRLRPFIQQRFRLRNQRDLQGTVAEDSCQKKKIAPRRVDKQAEISRKGMFYDSEISIFTIPKYHISKRLKPDMGGAMYLLKSIFGISVEGASLDMAQGFQQCSSRSESDPDSLCLYHSLLKNLRRLISKARASQSIKYLKKHCEVQSEDNDDVFEIENPKENEPYQRKHVEGTHFEEINSYCQKRQVVSFVWAACRSIISPDMLGTKKNWKKLRSNIKRFVQLRRYEKFSLRQCMHKLKTSEMPLFAKKQSLCCLSNQVTRLQGHNLEAVELTKSEASHVMKQRILESWIYWFFSHIVVPLLRVNFYVTESECGGHEIFYYTKSVWAKVRGKALSLSALNEKAYFSMSKSTARDFVHGRKFGFSKIRLLPKENGVRLLANLNAWSKWSKPEYSLPNESLGVAARGLKQRVKKRVETFYFKPVNHFLRDAHAVLKGVLLKEPELVGSSVFDYNDVYRKLFPFLTGLKSSSSAMPAVFIVSTDVMNAFETVDQDKLLTVLNDVLRQDMYTLKQYSEVCCNNNSIWSHEDLVLLDEDINSRVTSLSSCRSKNSIPFSQERGRKMEKRDLLFNLKHHVRQNMLESDGTFYWQRGGICQGSMISSQLCSLYYGDMENKVIFPFLERVNQHFLKDNPSTGGCQIVTGTQINDCSSVTRNSYSLLRWIDDFLFISTSKDMAEGFFSRLSRGVRDYNCYVNKDNFSVNFDTSYMSKPLSNRICVGKDGVSFLRWSGLLINCSTLEVQADYSKNLNIHLSSTLTVSWQGDVIRLLEEKLCGFLRLNCHPLFYDPKINSPGVVRLNIFQSFLFCAMNFHCYVGELSYIHKLGYKPYLRIIKSSSRYMYYLIKQKMSSPSLGPVTNSNFIPNPNPILNPQLGYGEVEWLGLNAYVQVLNRKQSDHKKLLSMLKHKLSVRELSRERSSELDYAVDESHSSLVWEIKY